MKYVTVLFIALIFSNCEGTKQTQENNPNADFEIIMQSDYGGKETKSYEIITSQSELNKALEGIQMEEVAMNKMKAIDFSKQVVLSLHSGLHNTGGYSIGVENVEVNGTTTYVTVKHSTPNLGEPVTMALTNPFCIAVIDKNETIVFNE
ncbi:MAG: protease complex subunit PrcB family protein [Flavobacteriaceae bacterium]|nr:protease complex subunit PrcB family protein [Flavobacteriaceae bacterium]